MKIYRLIGILSVLLQKDKVTAPELAKRFEVSRRTICRDIEALCKENLITWMLTCKDKVMVLEPEDVRNEIFHIAENIKRKYEV